MNQDDPFVDQIREIRHQISAEFDHDPEGVLAYYKEFEEKLLRERDADPGRELSQGDLDVVVITDLDGSEVAETQGALLGELHEVPGWNDGRE